MFALGSFHASFDDRIIIMATKFLVSIQNKDGSFVEVGRVNSRYMQVVFFIYSFVVIILISIDQNANIASLETAVQM